MLFDSWTAKNLKDGGYHGISDEQIGLVAKTILATGLTRIDRRVFDRACFSNGINPANFSDDDLARLQAALDRQQN